MSALAYWRKQIADQLGVDPSELTTPPDPTLGDFAYGTFRLAKEQKRSPADIAKEIADKMVPGTVPGIESVTAAGPYVNFTLSTGEAVKRVVDDVEKKGEAYGKSEIGADEGFILFEYANPNTHKELHVGHLRNMVLGQSLVPIMRLAGYDVHPVSYLNDQGMNVGKCLWRLVTMHDLNAREFDLKKYEELMKRVPEDKKTGNFLGIVYTEATRLLEEDEGLKEDISFVQQQLEKHDSAWEKLWCETRQWCVDEMYDIFGDLGVKIEKQFYESDLIDRSHQIVDELIEKKLAQESRGAVIVDLESEKLGVFVLRKADGTLLYSAKDLALAEAKIKEYPSMAKSYMLVDNRQSLYFRQLASVLKKMGVDVPFSIIGYELVVLKEGAMSSRKGNIVTYQFFRDEVMNFARKGIIQRHPEWLEEVVMHTAWTLTMSGIKFALLKQDNDRVFTFDMEQALSFDGATGPYCQYAATRLGSILKKIPKLENSKTRKKSLAGNFDHPSEKALAMVMAQFPARVEQAAKELRPSIIAQWCLEMAQAVNGFYRDVPVLESEGDLKEGRLRLASAARQVLAQGLGLLGIDLPDQM